MNELFKNRIFSLLDMMNIKVSSLPDEDVVTLSIDDKLYIYMSELPEGVLVMFAPLGSIPKEHPEIMQHLLGANLFTPDYPKPTLGYDEASDSLVCWQQIDLSKVGDTEIFRLFEEVMLASEHWAAVLQNPLSITATDAGEEINKKKGDNTENMVRA